MAFTSRISFAEARILIPKNSERRSKMINYIDNDELPIGFTMELALHSDILNKFAHMDKARQEQIVNGARTVNSRDEMRNYVESIAKM